MYSIIVDLNIFFLKAACLQIMHIAFDGNGLIDPRNKSFKRIPCIAEIMIIIVCSGSKIYLQRLQPVYISERIQFFFPGRIAGLSKVMFL